MNELWHALVVSILMIALCLYILPGDGTFWGTRVPAAGLYLLIVCGVIISILSIRGLLRGEGKKKPPTDKDIHKAKEALENMHRHEHGTLPEYTGGLDELKDNNKK